MNAAPNSTQLARLLVEKTFSIDDQLRFAELSGDRNPVHLDPLAARRSLAKEPVVHGIHAVLWAIEGFFSQVSGPGSIRGLKVRFEFMMPVDGALQAWLISRDDRAARIDILRDGRAAAVVLIAFGERQEAQRKLDCAPLPFVEDPLEHAFDEVGAGAAVQLRPKGGLVAAFPNAARNLGGERLQGLAATSYVVGMACPGRWSIYRSLNVTATEGTEGAQRLSFQVAHIDTRFRMVRCAVEGAGWTGSFDAHDAPEPVTQPTMAAVSNAVRPGEFAGIRSLVIGGSRGLGELAGKLLAAGGADVELTYRVGRDDALRVLDEIKAAGGRGSVRRLEFPPDGASFTGAFDFHQIYYMASPPIVKGASDNDVTLARTYEAVFVDGFAQLCGRIAEQEHPPLSIFYPSSVFVEQTPDGFGAYIKAKRVGEQLCEALSARMPGDRILVRRLPALPTDQTQSLITLDLADSIEVMLPIVRAMRR